MGGDLSGLWRAALGDDELRRRFTDPTFDDGDWEELAVPGHWQSTPAFSGSGGPVLYRRGFTAASAPAVGRRSFVVLDGCFYQGDVWLDGSYLGDTEGYFLPHAFEVTALLQGRSEHVLAVELTCDPEPAAGAKRNLTGAFQQPPFAVDPRWNPGGIWRPVRLVETGPVRIGSLRLRCTEATSERACLDVTAALDAAEAGAVDLRTVVAPAAVGRAGGEVEHVHRAQLGMGTNEVSWRVEVPAPSLWWPRALQPGGDRPSLVDVDVEVRLTEPAPVGAPDDGVSDRARRRTGLRQVRMRRWVLEVNGERLFVKGASLGPTRLALAEASSEDVDRDVRLAQEAGLDLLRVHAHIARPELYDAADRAGLLLWQDLPLQGAYAAGVRSEGLRQSAAAVDLLAHHPSIALWCAHDIAPAGAERPSLRALLPSSSTAVGDAALARVLEAADSSRPVVPRPPIGTAISGAFGWRQGDERDLPRWLRRFPVLARFVSGFGAQSVPETAEWMEPDRWPDLDWQQLATGAGMHKPIFDRRVPPAAYPTFEAWRAVTQQHQATLVRHHVEELRRLKYRPTGGFCLHFLADAAPAVSCSVLDHERVPKAGFAALRAACAPVLVTADRLAPWYRPGATVAVDVHVVSDLRRPLEGCTLRADLNWSGGSHRWGFTGDLPADTVQRVGTLSFVVPAAPGPLSLDLRLEGAVPATTNYRSEIVPSA